MRVRYAHFEETHNVSFNQTSNTEQWYPLYLVPAVVLSVVVLEVRCNLFEVSVKTVNIISIVNPLAFSCVSCRSLST